VFVNEGTGKIISPDAEKSGRYLKYQGISACSLTNCEEIGYYKKLSISMATFQLTAKKSRFCQRGSE